MAASAIDRVRAICLALPDTSERLSHGTPHFFAGKKNFVAYWNNHHEDGRHCIWCAAPEGAQHLMVEGALPVDLPEQVVSPGFGRESAASKFARRRTGGNCQLGWASKCGRE